MNYFISSILLVCLTVASAFPRVDVLASRQAASSLSPISFTKPLLEPNIITTFPNGTWIENLTPRSVDGNFLATALSSPDVYLISSTSEFEPAKIASFPGNLGALGIVELGLDVFCVVVGNYSVSKATVTPGSWSIWQIDLNQANSSATHNTWSAWGKATTKESKSIPAITRKVTDLPKAGLLNGLTVLNPNTGVVLVSDSLNGSVWSVNVLTGHVTTVITDPTMKPHPELSGGLSIGINGLSVNNGYLYYDNTNEVTFNRIPINATTGVAIGPAETLIDNEFANIWPDDFTLDFAGNAWLACEWGHIAFLEGMTSGKKPGIKAVVQNVTMPNGFSAARFGTSEEDLKRGSLYVSTNGGPYSYGTENPAKGQLIRFDTAELGFY